MEIKEGHAEVSIYGDQLAGQNHIALAVAKITASYPQLFGRMNPDTIQQFGLAIADAIRKSGMSAQQLDDAVTNCIIHNPTFAISDVCGYDQKVKLYPYAWSVGKAGFVRSNLKWEHNGTWEYWWCKAQDVEKVNRIAEFKNKK